MGIIKVPTSLTSRLLESFPDRVCSLTPFTFFFPPMLPGLRLCHLSNQEALWWYIPACMFVRNLKTGSQPETCLSPLNRQSDWNLVFCRDSKYGDWMTEYERSYMDHNVQLLLYLLLVYWKIREHRQHRMYLFTWQVWVGCSFQSTHHMLPNSLLLLVPWTLFFPQPQNWFHCGTMLDKSVDLVKYKMIEQKTPPQFFSLISQWITGGIQDLYVVIFWSMDRCAQSRVWM